MITTKLDIYMTETSHDILDLSFSNLQGDTDYISCQHDVKINFQRLNKLLDTVNMSRMI